MSARAMPTDSAQSAGWALRVSSSVAGSAFSTRSATSKPSTSEAHENVSATSGTSMRSAPMPGFCAPWPEHRNTGAPAETERFTAAS